MKINNNIKIKQVIRLFVTIIVISVSIVSCDDLTDDFLEVENRNGIDLEIKDLEDSTLGLNGLYNTLLNDNTFNPVLFGLLSDEGSLGGNRIPNSEIQLNVQFLNITNHTFTNASGIIDANYSALYRGILQANYVIDGLQNIEESIQGERDLRSWRRQMAEARFFRGLFYYFLRWTYNEGNLVLIKDFSVRAQNATLRGLSTAEEVEEFYKADLQHAIDNLAVGFFRGSDASETVIATGRITQGAAIMLMANHHLYKKEYSEAIPLYRTLIDDPDLGYRLADPKIMFTEAGDLNSESILEVLYDADALPTVDVFQHVTPNSMLAARTSFVGNFNPPLLPASWLIAEYQEEQFDIKNEDLNKKVTVERFNGTFEERDRTISRRASAMLATVQDEHTPFYLAPTALEFSTRGSGPFAVNNRTAYAGMFKKYTNHDIAAAENRFPLRTNSQNLRSGKNVALLRLSEAHINLAECLIKTNEVDAAIEELNIIRKRWGLVLLGPDKGDEFTYNGITYTEDTLMQQLMFVDKPLEMSVEGLAIRYIDLRRWNENGEPNTGADRFKFLSNEEFTFRHYDATVITTRRRFNALLIKFPIDKNKSLKTLPASLVREVVNGRRIVHSQFGVTAQNYKGYLPLPFSEVEFNNNL